MRFHPAQPEIVCGRGSALVARRGCAEWAGCATAGHRARLCARVLPVALDGDFCGSAPSCGAWNGRTSSRAPVFPRGAGSSGTGARSVAALREGEPGKIVEQLVDEPAHGEGGTPAAVAPARFTCVPPCPDEEPVRRAVHPAMTRPSTPRSVPFPSPGMKPTSPRDEVVLSSPLATRLWKDVMRTIICTAGTSIAPGKVAELRNDPEAYRRAIRQRVRDEEEAHGGRTPDLLRLVSAETNSLQAMNATNEDAIFLLHTDTEDGEICAQAVADVLERHRGIKANLQRIANLQMVDAEGFRRRGVQALFQTLQRLVNDAHGHEIALNVTGGFKSVVPYVTLFGLLKLVPVYYIFERSNALLRLPSVPIQYDYERLGRAGEALRKLRAEGALEREAFFAAIPGLDYHEREWYAALLDEEDGLVTLSAFGMLVTDDTDRNSAQVLVSPGARRTYDSSTGLARDQFTQMLERIGDPLWRRAKYHAFHGSDLQVFKPGATAQRLAGLVRGQVVYVCELFPDHITYERLLPGKLARDYSLSEFAPWQRPTDEPEPPSTDEEFVARLVEERDLARAQEKAAWAELELVDGLVKSHEAAVADLKGRLAQQSVEIADVHARAGEARGEVDRLSTTLESAQSTIANLQAALAEAEDSRNRQPPPSQTRSPWNRIPLPSRRLPVALQLISEAARVLVRGASAPGGWPSER